MEFSKLTPEQSKMIEENMRLVTYTYENILKKTELVRKNRDEIFQEGYFGLCLACQRFNEDYGVKFATYAVSYILNSMRKFTYKLHKHNILSLQETAPDDEGRCLEDFIEAPQKEIGVENEMVMNYVMGKVSPKQAKILKLSMKYDTQKEVAKEMQCSQVYVSKTITKIKKMTVKELGYENA